MTEGYSCQFLAYGRFKCYYIRESGLDVLCNSPFCGCLFNISKSEDKDMSIDYYRRLINMTEDYIETNLNHKITLAHVANNANISQFHFHRLFSKYSTETLKQFITRIKMERSAIFLAINSEISITEIALKYGYSSSSNYNKAFKKHYSMSPTEFRKEQERKRNNALADV